MRSSESPEQGAALGGESLPRTARILKRADFLQIQETGTKLYCRNFLLFLRERGDVTEAGMPALQGSRLGVTITRKVHKRTVQRNRLRRRIKELFRRIRASLSADIDLVVIARSDATRLELAEIERQIVGALERKRLLLP